ncbi:sulfite exporter TauE/SafE family protein [Microbacterium horticulturae]|uniref:Probable membrane transporter protein n=1 Tax=Microbacterium horticulturae TaxID=3028316 RepID=A0ABY8C332_9MICO|nr:sulfite exporter TauE/SafE family protein [Microbacterium sp. KACC 23027]WEG09253.1 sulfite exporter TauE/SafE family protein [Microbacterium sp. KACC 23027]
MSLLLTAIAVCIIAALAAAAQAVSGFGFAMLSVPLMIPVLGAPSSVVVATVLGLVLTIGSTIAERRAVEWRPVFALSGAALVGIPIGLAVLQFLDPHWLSLVIGVVVIGATVLLARRTPLQLESRRGIVAAGVLSGAMLSSTGMNGPPVVAVFQTRGLRPVAFRASLQAAFAIQDLLAIIGFVFVARLTPQVGLLALIAVPALVLGWWLGDRLFHRIGQGAFRWIVLGMLLLSGLLAIIQAAVQLSG